MEESFGFPSGSAVKNPPSRAGDMGLILGSGRSPGEGNGNPFQYSCLENPMDRGAWWATVCAVLGCSVLADSAIPWTVVCQAPLSMEFYRPVTGYWSIQYLEWVAIPFSRGSSQPRNKTGVSCIAGGFLTSWATRRSQATVSGVLKESDTTERLTTRKLNMRSTLLAKLKVYNHKLWGISTALSVWK